MANAPSLTTRQAGDLLGQPEWRIRRIVDGIAGIQRFGGKRMIPRSAIPAIVDGLRERGWLVETAAAGGGSEK